MNKKTAKDLTEQEITRIPLNVKLQEFGFKISDYTIVRPYFFLKKLFLVTGIIVWLGIIITSVLIIGFFRSLPNENELKFDELRERSSEIVFSKLVDKQSPHQWCGIDEINRDFLYAVVMAEDGTFFTHQGINYDAFFYAIGEDIKRRKLDFGASTISQQVTKNLFLKNDKTFIRKIKEMLATRRLENALTKNQILELYMNVAEFGPDIYGAQQAAEYYFHKQPLDINAAEGAFICLLLPSPRKYHYMLFQNHNITPRHRKKYERILKDMLFKEYISPELYQNYLHYDFFKESD